MNPPRAVSFSWDDLRVFLEVARRGGLSQAAKRLGLDHSTVSRRIAQLELALGTKLFARTRSGLVLQLAGQLLLQHAEAMETRVLAATASISSQADEGTVRLAMMEFIGSVYLAPRLLSLYTRHPGVQLELVASAQSFNLSRREADLFLSVFRPTGRGLFIRKIGEFEMNLYASPSYLKQHGTPTTVEDLEKHAFVSYIDDLIAIDAVRWLSEIIENPRVVFHSNNMLAQQHAAVAGLGLAMLPCFSAAPERRLQKVPIKGRSVKRDLWLSVHRDLQETPRVCAVMEFLIEIINADRELLLGH